MPENLVGQCTMCPEPAAGKHDKFNVVDGGSRRTHKKGRNPRCGITVEPPGMVTGFRKLEHVPDDLEGIPFSAGAMSAQGTRNVYADKHFAVPLSVPFRAFLKPL